jgi:Doubled CXXCH motif (Paired_CXXCH_1)
MTFPSLSRLRPDLNQAVALGVIFTALLLPSRINASAQTTRTSPSSEPTLPHFDNTAPGVGYAGSKACATCHPSIYTNFEKTDMGRSMSLPSDPSQLAKVSADITIHVPKLDRSFAVARHGRNLYQTEFQPGPGGQDIFKNTQKLAFVIGAGRNGISYIVQMGDYLFEAPLSYYSLSDSWALSPGYQFADYGFSRPIAERCVLCHSGRPEPVMNRDGLFKDPPFRELAIGCENCHGPGELHIRERKQGKPVKGAIDRSIVNPAKIPGWLSDNICMSCHQGGDTRVLQPGQRYQDFRPGTPLADTVAIFEVPLSPENLPKSPLLQHYDLMILSKCYRASHGALSCITCHDPHQQPAPAESVTYYREKCLTCHTEKSCGLPLKSRLAQSPPDDCVSCHMPKEPVRTISHSVLTDHRIIATKDEPFPEEAFHRTTPALPDLYYVDAIPGQKNRPVPPIVLFKAYGELMGTRPEYEAAYERVLSQLTRENSTDPLVLSAIARRDVKEGTPAALEDATTDLREAIHRGSTLPSDFELLANLLVRAGHADQAIEVMKQGIALNPYSPRLYKVLALQYIAVRQYPEALQAMREELKLFPQDSMIRMLIEKGEAASAVH